MNDIMNLNIHGLQGIRMVGFLHLFLKSGRIFNLFREILHLYRLVNRCTSHSQIVSISVFVFKKRDDRFWQRTFHIHLIKISKCFTK
jgi:hypothetical protein